MNDEKLPGVINWSDVMSAGDGASSKILAGTKVEKAFCERYKKYVQMNKYYISGVTGACRKYTIYIWHDRNAESGGPDTF